MFVSISNISYFENEALKGGGIFCEHSSPIFQNVTICGNIAIKRTMLKHTSGIGGGLCNFNGKINLNKTTIAGNIANRGGGIYCNIDNVGVALEISNSIIWYNSPDEIQLWDEWYELKIVTVAYSNIKGGINGVKEENNSGTTKVFWLNGNTDSDPMFVDTTNGDYRMNDGSPCIDAGIQDTFIVYNDGQYTIFIPPMDYIGSAPDMGAYEYGDPLAIKNELPLAPNKYYLSQNYPNPFNPSTTIEFTLPKSEYVELKVYNILGKEVSTLVSNKLNQGNHTYTFDGKNLASGIYYYQLVAGDFREVKKMILLR